MKFSTGGKAHEPQGMIRCNSEADSIVWMKEEKLCAFLVRMYCIKLGSKLWNSISGAFSFFAPGTCKGRHVILTEYEWMRRAIELAKQGEGWTSPNPLVGAVIVKQGQIIGEGYHARYGEYHAERNALMACTEPAEGADLYVTLEPCCHYGKQPPCVEAIVQAGIRRVFVGSDDPNPLVAGKGIRYLRERGITVETHVLKEECDRLNPVFFHYIRKKTPYVVMKYAMTMDGKIAAYTGASKWVTGEQARANVQQERHRYRGIMVGVGTVLADDPMLSCRMPGGRNPVRIICDTHLRTPLSSQVVKTAKEISTILAVCETDKSRYQPYQEAGCQILTLPDSDGHLDLNALMEKLGEERIDSVLLEGGGTLNWAALKSGIVREVHAYMAPKLFGGSEAKTPVEGQGVPDPAEAVHLKVREIRHLGEDLLIESEVQDVYGNC